MDQSLIMGFATAFNVLIIFKKIEKKRFQDAFFDGSLLVTLTVIFGGSLGGMLVATVASAVISLYFLFSEPKILPSFEKVEENDNENIDEILTAYKTKYNIK